ncbi:hypothetical protein BDZ85DRAFT_265760 [Elsinoe ampelina]|uniref:F-box domain-containing protein n=1 Tax=Elsinoe ampelina TaxID=302913 RepID=A0A6A6G4Z9_9PEZI|nr:hypothetical protein BDZ85DRAFT_265760 [Elsinoe ampelina]
MDDLPTEIKLVIAQHVAHMDPETNHMRIPQLPLSPRKATGLKYGTLKSLSSLNKQWRVIAKPHLFSHLVLYMGEGVSGNYSTSTRFRLAINDAAESLTQLPHRSENQSEGPIRIDSLAIEIDELLVSNSQALRNPARHSTDIITMFGFWRRIFEAVDPTRLAIVAPVSILGYLITTIPNMSDEWAFKDMSTQMLELSQSPDRPYLKKAPENPKNAAWDTEYLFNARPWKELQLMEGSMLQAYGIYEYFHRQPPTILQGLILPRSEHLESMRLHCLFPFSSHVDELHVLSLTHYKHLHFHFSPCPNMSVLDDSSVVGKADMADCWREMEQIYQMLCRHLLSAGEVANLVEFSTGDYAVESIRRILEEGFLAVAAQGWSATGDGKWRRPSKSP